MDFVFVLPMTKVGNDMFWVVVDRFAKSATFLPMKNTCMMDAFPKAYVKWMVKYHHSVSKDIVVDRDSRFLSNFLQSLRKALYTNLLMSTTFHPTTDGQTERTIKTLEDMMQFFLTWSIRVREDDFLGLIEFSYNNSHEALYGQKCRSPVCWNDISETAILEPEVLEETVKQVKVIQEQIKATQD